MISEIIIVKFAAPELEERCISSVIKNTTCPYHLRVFDNYQKKYNLGQLWNRLIIQSESDFVCLLNSDTTVSEGWLDKLIDTFSKLQNIGCVGPTTDNSRNQQSKVIPPQTFVDFGKEYPGWCLSGFCLIFPKEVFLEVGGFPDNFGFYGQEVALIDKMMKKGYRQIWRTDVFVHHDGGGSIKPAEKRGEINEQMERKLARENYQLLRNKLNEDKHL